LQRLLQQTPPVQKLLPQTLSREQGAPRGSRPHRPSMQVLGATQSLLLLQEVPQRLPAHLKEPQLRAAAVVQTPALQVLVGVERLLVALHDWFLQTVPSG
jgi:hypothetical protein